MKILKKLSLAAGLTLATYLIGKLVWVLFWGFLIKLFVILKTIVAVAIVGMGLYVLWKILSGINENERH
ncbi:MAG: hypothetical protein AB1489_13215 [Acidobacteriota bacterium]